MIVPMKKVSLVVFARDCEDSLLKLREAGVLHISKRNISSETLTRLLDRQAKVKRALAILSRYVDKKDISPSSTPADSSIDGKDLAACVLGLADEKKTCQDELVRNSKEKQRLTEWGEVDPESLADLEKNGVTLIPYEIPMKTYNALDKDIKLLVLSKDKKAVKAFSVEEKIEGLTPFVFTRSLSQIDECINNNQKRIEEIEAEFKNQARSVKILEEEEKRLPVDIEFESAKADMERLEEVNSVCWLSGFIPADELDRIKLLAEEYEWALVWEDPKAEDKPPTLLRNNKVVRIINPLFSFLGTIPGYREQDISLPFLVFFCLFFAMILGDAAYGLLLFTVSTLIGLSMKKKSGQIPDIVKFAMLLTFCTVIWGTITGAWFAIPMDKLPPFLRALVIPPFNNSGPVAEFPVFMQSIFNLPAEVPMDDLKTRWNIQFLCFSIAVIQLGMARVSNIKRKLPNLAAFSEVGYFVLLLGLYFLVLFMLLKVPLPSFVPYFIGAGLGLNLIFSEQYGGNFFKNILKSFSNFITLFISAVGNFGDIISYIRLFAVGVAGATIASTFNDMAIGDGLGSFGIGFLLKLLAAVLILVFGHGLNLIMGALSVLVHAVRLNLLEFAGNHLGIEWSGYEYKPFAVKQKIKVKE